MSIRGGCRSKTKPCVVAAGRPCHGRCGARRTAVGLAALATALHLFPTRISSWKTSCEEGGGGGEDGEGRCAALKTSHSSWAGPAAAGRLRHWLQRTSGVGRGWVGGGGGAANVPVVRPRCPACASASCPPSASLGACACCMARGGGRAGERVVGRAKGQGKCGRGGDRARAPRGTCWEISKAPAAAAAPAAAPATGATQPHREMSPP